MASDALNLLKDLRVFDLPSRINRIKYWVVSGLYVILFYALLFAVKKIFIFGELSSLLSTPVTLLLWLVYIIQMVQLHVKRLHDIGMQGWWLLLILIPLVNILFVLYLALKAGDNGKNKFGANPPKATAFEFFVAMLYIVLYIVGAIVYMIFIKI